jgi:hypothetical protein
MTMMCFLAQQGSPECRYLCQTNSFFWQSITNNLSHILSHIAIYFIDVALHVMLGWLSVCTCPTSRCLFTGISSCTVTKDCTHLCVIKRMNVHLSQHMEIKIICSSYFLWSIIALTFILLIGYFFFLFVCITFFA